MSAEQPARFLRWLKPLELFVTGLAILAACADDMRMGRFFLWGGRLLLWLAAAYPVLMLVYALRGMDWLALLPDGLTMLATGLLLVGFARLVAYRQRLRAEDALAS
jgi:hypothetical protein